MTLTVVAIKNAKPKDKPYNLISRKIIARFHWLAQYLDISGFLSAASSAR